MNLSLEFSEPSSLLSALLNAKEMWRDRDLQMTLRYKNSLSRLLTDKICIGKVSESPSHLHIELSKPLLILG